MASIAKEPNGNRRILFVALDGSRKTLRLGKVPQRVAEAIKYRVEHILAAKRTGYALDADTASWLAELEKPLAEKLANVGLIPKQAEKEAATLAPFIARYVAGRTDVKPASKEVWRQGEMGLVEFFGPEKPLADISAGDADEYKVHLMAKGLAPMTVRKRLQFAKTIFRSAVRHRLIVVDPFQEVTVKAGMPDRSRFITPAETQRLLDVAPNHDWRTIIALARWGGLRCPSEVLSLRWQDVLWDDEQGGKLIVQSPKTEHHPGKECRTIPLFPELRPILQEAFELAPEGAVYVVDERMRASAQGPGGWRNCNLRTQFNRIIATAGMQPWPRLFHNLRSSRQTELAERYPSHVVCAWLGNSVDIAQKHYLQVTPEHFASAAVAAAVASEGLSPLDLGAVQRGAESGALVAQNPAQQASAQNRKVPKGSTESPPPAALTRLLASHNPLLQNNLADGVGFEPTEGY